MNSLTESDLKTFQEAIYSDYGVKLEGQELYDAAFTLLQFTEALLKFDKADKDRANAEKVLKSY